MFSILGSKRTFSQIKKRNRLINKNAPVAQLDRVLPSEADYGLSNDNIFVADIEFLSEQIVLDRFVRYLIYSL